MPLHEWKNVDFSFYHHFHQTWSVEICRALNCGVLPEPYSALVEKKYGIREPDVVAVELEQTDELGAGSGGTAILERPKTRVVRQLSDDEFYAEKANRIVIRHRLGRVVAFIEIVSPGNKKGTKALNQFVEKIGDAIRNGVHVLVVDPFPPTSRDPFGIHKAIRDNIDEQDFELPPHQERVLASYEAVRECTAFIETIGVGELLPAMPLFIEPGAHVLVPLEETCMAAWDDSPAALRRAVSQPEPTP